MRICIVIPRDEWRDTAGVRIRYDRLAPELARLGHVMELRAMGEIRAARRPSADVYVFCKCHDLRAVILARVLRAGGARVGVDFFDDYYSQQEDARFTHLRRWFRAIVPELDFAMCATPRMAERLARLAPRLPCHVVNDPFARFDAGAIGQTVARNAAHARATRSLAVGWFGIGDNPHFPVGLDDLFAFSGALARAREHGYAPRLDILTNRRAMTPERMEMLARMAMPWTIEEWTEEREAALIARSLLCFLPVNAQGFSVVKSLNRGVTTLTGGAQVLSAGFPLYEALDDFVYRDIGDLIADLEADRLKLRAETLDTLARCLDRLGSPRQEAGKLAEFLAALPRPATTGWPPRGTPTAVIHGINSSGEIHKLVQQARMFSVASPLYRGKYHFDVAIGRGKRAGTLRLTLSERAVAALLPVLKDRVQQTAREDGKTQHVMTIDPAKLPGGPYMRGQAAFDAPRVSGVVRIPDLEVFADAVALSRAVLEFLFGPIPVLLSEIRAPYWAGAVADAGIEPVPPADRPAPRPAAAPGQRTGQGAGR